MKPYISQTKDTGSCGACSIAYYLWETNKAKCVNDRNFIQSIHRKIQLGPNNMGIPEAYSNPEKMSKELNDNWHSYSYTCILSNSHLVQLAKRMNICGADVDALDKVKSGDSKYAIIMCSLGNISKALHYVLVKYEDNTFKLLNSSSIYGNGVDNVVWEKFIVESNGKLTLERDCPYWYTGIGIVIE